MPETASGIGLARPCSAGQYQLAIDFLKRAAVDMPEARLEFAIALYAAGSLRRAMQVLEQVPETARGGDYLLIKARILGCRGTKTAEAGRSSEEGLQLSFTRADE